MAFGFWAWLRSVSRKITIVNVTKIVILTPLLTLLLSQREREKERETIPRSIRKKKKSIDVERRQKDQRTIRGLDPIYRLFLRVNKKPQKSNGVTSFEFP